MEIESMDMLKSEIRKLLTKRTVAALLLLAFINPILGLYIINTPNDDGYTMRDYSSLYQEISAYGRADALAELEERSEFADTFGEANLCARVYGEVKAVFTYDEYLDSIFEKSGEIEVMSRFADGGGFAARNAEKTEKVYGKLKETELKPCNPMGLLGLTDSDVTDYIAVIMIFVVAVNLVFSEKNDNQISLLRTTVHGRRRLMASKVIVMCLSVALIVGILYGLNAITDRCVFGGADLTSPVQSVYIYRSSPWKLNTGGFLIAYFIVKTLSCILLGLFFMLMCAVSDHIVFVFAASASAVFAEIICYTKIPETHFLVFLKYLNIMYGVKGADMLSNYVNLNVFGYPVNTVFLYALLWLVLTSAAALTVVCRLDSPHEKRTASPRIFLRAFPKRHDFVRNTECHTSIFLHECHKLLFTGRGLVVLICSLLFVIRWNPAEKIQFDSPDEVYYKEYMDSLYGPLDEEKYALLSAEEEKYAELTESIYADTIAGKSENYISIKYKSEFERQGAFDMVREHVGYLEARGGGWLFYEKGYDILTDGSHSANRDLSQAFVYVIILVAMTYGIRGVDCENAEIRLLRTTYNGRGRLDAVKRTLGILCTLASFVFVYVVRVINVLGAYGIRGIDAPAACMEHLSDIPHNITVLQYILLVMTMRLCGGLIVTGCVSALTKIFKNGIPVIISCIVIFMIPLALVAFDVNGAQYILLNPLLLGNVY